ncbi:MAG: DUF2752 domain-containing protein [Thermodesulfobacteriota bacterium]|nr:DUF2752 domain-containing protein [Thermodesulfobacteriota bacterium]
MIQEGQLSANNKASGLKLFSLAILGGWLFVSLSINAGLINIDFILDNSPLLCPFKTLTGIPCPGCGMGRAFLSLAGFQICDAFKFHPFSFFLLSFFLLQIFPFKNRVDRILNRRHIYLFMLFVLIFWWLFFRLIPYLIWKIPF